jgi:peptidyl-tRNA hydrolase
LSQDLEQMKAAAAEARANATNKQRKTAAQQLANLYAKIPNQLRSLKDLQQLEQLARTRKEWIQLVNDAHALQLQQWKSQREKAK